MLNSRSLSNKEIHVRNCILDNGMYFGIVTEMWYKDDSWGMSDINTFGLKTHMVNRKNGKFGGGLALVYRQQYQYETLKTQSYPACELGLWLLKIKGIHQVILGVYHPPYSTQNRITDIKAIDDLLNCLSEILPEYSNIIIMGDFHYNNLEDSLIYILDDSLHALGLDQLVEEPTHKDGNILDLVIAKSWNSLRNYTVKVGEFLSDYNFVTIHMDLLKEPHHLYTPTPGILET